MAIAPVSSALGSSASNSSSQTSSPSATQLDAQNPWPGLAAYDEDSQAFFHGREEDATELLRLIHLAPLTVLYGNSGLGKSSLLQAGLFPRLRSGHFLPVYLRVDFSDQAEAPPLEQVARRLEQEIARVGGDCPRRETGEDLWQYLHRKDLEIWSADNFPLTPVLVFDQFEELFSRSGGNRARIDAVFHGLADLIENRIPAEVADDATASERRARLDLLAQRYRILLAFREDFLPEVETWKDKVPTLLRNRLRLLPMSRAQAIAATERAGAAVLEPGVAARIVDFVASREGETGGGVMAHEPGIESATAESSTLESNIARTSTLELNTVDSSTAPTVEPVLLSLCCTQLNRRRPPGGKIDAALLASAGQDILQSFYREALAGMPERVPRFIETHLIQGDRYRGNYPRDEALARGDLSAEELATLTDRFRLLRIDQLADTARIELIHDRLVSIVRDARDARLADERELEQQRLRQVAEAEAQRERERREHAERDRARLKRMRNGLVGLALLFLGAGGIAGWAAWSAKQAESRAIAATDDAEKRRREAIAANIKLDKAVKDITAEQKKASTARDEALKQKGVAVMAQKLAQSNQQRAELSEQTAFVRFRQATGLKLLAEVQAMQAGTRPGSKERALLQLLAAHRIGPGAEVDGGMLDRILALRDMKRWIPAGATVNCVAFSPDGRRMVSGSDNALRLWDATTGQPIGTPLQGHKDMVGSVAFSPDGRRIVSGSNDSTLRLWDAITGQPIGAPLQGHEGAVLSVVFSPDGGRIVSGSYDKTLRLWDANTGQPIGAPLQGHKDGVQSVAFSPDGGRIVSGSYDKTLRLWDAHTGQPIGTPLQGHMESVSSVAFSPSGRRIVSGSYDKTLRLWDVNTGQPIGAPLQGHEGAVESVAFSPDGRRIVSGSWDKSLRLWDANTGQLIRAPLQGHESYVRSVAFSPDGGRLVSGSYDNTLRVWDANTGQPMGALLQEHKDVVDSVAFSPDGRRIISGSWDKSLRLWDANTGQRIGAPLQGHESSVSSVAFSPDSRRIVSGSWDNTLRLWDANTGQPIGAPLQGHKEAVTSVAFSPAGRRIVSGSKDKTLRLWDANTGQPIGVPLIGHEKEVDSVAFSPDGRRIVSGSGDTLRLWDAHTGRPIGALGHESGVNSVAYSPDGRRIVSSSWGNKLRLWDAHTGQPIGTPLQGHTESVSSVAFSPDGRRIVSGSDDKTLRLWDANTGQPIGVPLLGHESRVSSVTFSPDGRSIVSGNWDHTLRLWPAPDAWPDELCAKLTRNMSRKQWREWVSPDIPYDCQCPGLPIAPDDPKSTTHPERCEGKPAVSLFP